MALSRRAARIEPPGPRPVLSACLIVKNEARYLDGCLRSLGGLVDEVVVVDTGSTDGSERIARKRGARVFDFEWTDDFAAARPAWLTPHGPLDTTTRNLGATAETWDEAKSRLIE